MSCIFELGVSDQKNNCVGLGQRNSGFLGLRNFVQGGENSFLGLVDLDFLKSKSFFFSVRCHTPKCMTPPICPTWSIVIYIDYFSIAHLILFHHIAFDIFVWKTKLFVQNKFWYLVFVSAMSSLAICRF